VKRRTQQNKLADMKTSLTLV